MEAEQARAAAERAAQLKTAFLARMSHELRTPLNAIGGYVQLLEMGLAGPLNERQRDYLVRIRHSEEHLLALLDELLDLARAESGRLHFDMAYVSLAETLARVEEMTAPQLEARMLYYQFLAPATELMVHADEEKLRRILLNLVSNASKNTEAGGQVRVWCDVVSGRPSIHVSDTGHGIAPDQLERIFEPFVQLPGAAPGSHGFGLGLSICRELARGMGGEIVVESVPGQGSTFTLLLNAPRHTAIIPLRTEPQPGNAGDD